MCLICQMQYDGDHEAWRLAYIEKDPEVVKELPFVCRRCHKFRVEDAAELCYHCFAKESYLDPCTVCVQAARG